MARQGYDLQLTRYDDKGWRATFCTTGMEHSPTSAQTPAQPGGILSTRSRTSAEKFRTFSIVRSVADGDGAAGIVDRDRKEECPMAHFRGVGGFSTLKKGETAYWETTYENLLDEGIVTQAPNLLDESATNVEMIVLYQSVLLRPSGDRSGPVYKVAIKNAGTEIMSYNLNIEDWQ
jgi:hypothetical protein